MVDIDQAKALELDDDVELVEGFIRQNFMPGRAIGVMACLIGKLLVEQAPDPGNTPAARRLVFDLIDGEIERYRE